MKTLYEKMNTAIIIKMQESEFYTILKDNIISEKELCEYANEVQLFQDKEKFDKSFTLTEHTVVYKQILPKITFTIDEKTFSYAVDNERDILAVTILLNYTKIITPEIIILVGETIPYNFDILEKMVLLCSSKTKQDIFSAIVKFYGIKYVRYFYKKWKDDISITHDILKSISSPRVLKYCFKKMEYISSETIHWVFKHFKNPFAEYESTFFVRKGVIINVTQKEMDIWKNFARLVPHLCVTKEVHNDICFICQEDLVDNEFYTTGKYCCHRVHTACKPTKAKFRCFCGKLFSSY